MRLAVNIQSDVVDDEAGDKVSIPVDVGKKLLSERLIRKVTSHTEIYD